MIKICEDARGKELAEEVVCWSKTLGYNDINTKNIKRITIGNMTSIFQHLITHVHSEDKVSEVKQLLKESKKTQIKSKPNNNELREKKKFLKLKIEELKMKENENLIKIEKIKKDYFEMKVKEKQIEKEIQNEKEKEFLFQKYLQICQQNINLFQFYETEIKRNSSQMLKTLMESNSKFKMKENLELILLNYNEDLNHELLVHPQNLIENLIGQISNDLILNSGFSKLKFEENIQSKRVLLIQRFIETKKLQSKLMKLEEEIKDLSEINYKGNVLLKEFHEKEIKYSSLNSIIEIIEKNLKPIQKQENSNIKITKYEKYIRIIQQNDVKIKILKREIKDIFEECFKENLDHILKQFTNKRNELEYINDNMIKNELNLISKINWDLFKNSTSLEDTNLDEIKEILNFPKYKSNEEFKQYIQKLLTIKENEKYDFEIKNDSTNSKIRKIKRD
eukprot:gene4929-8526_t